mgnify:CR=1 FL=1
MVGINIWGLHPVWGYGIRNVFSVHFGRNVFLLLEPNHKSSRRLTCMRFGQTSVPIWIWCWHRDRIDDTCSLKTQSCNAWRLDCSSILRRFRSIGHGRRSTRTFVWCRVRRCLLSWLGWSLSRSRWGELERSYCRGGGLRRRGRREWRCLSGERFVVRGFGLMRGMLRLRGG